MVMTIHGWLEERYDEQVYGELYPFLNWLIIHIPSFVEIDDEMKGKGNQTIRQ